MDEHLTTHEIHILNGDALLEKFPFKNSKAEYIIVRECLIEGPVEINPLSRFFHIRSEYLMKKYPDHIDYRSQVQSEFEKLYNSLPGTTIYLWFEYDLFCQVNFWFCCHLINTHLSSFRCYWVVPNHKEWGGFGNMNSNELKIAFVKKKRLTTDNISSFDELWNAFQSSELLSLTALGTSLANEFPVLPSVVEAHLDRFPSTKFPESKLNSTIIEYKKNHPSIQFGEFFRWFSKEYGIYGFGDLQFKSLLESLGLN